MKAGMRFSTDESHADETEDVFGISFVTDGASEDCAGIGDLIVIDVLSRVAIGEAFEGESG